MTALPLSLGSYAVLDTRASGKRLVGCMSELADTDAPADSKSQVDPAYLRRMPGIRNISGFNDNSGLPVRGMWEMNGVEYVVIGPNLYSVAISAVTQVATLALLGGGITGTSFVRMTDNGACLVIIQPGTSNAWTYSLSGGFQQLLAPFFVTLGALDCWFVDTFIVFLALNGTTFFNDDGRQVSGNGQITFTTAASFGREFGTDLFVGGTVDHREILLMGTRTSEGYVNAGNPVGTPFSSAPDSYMQIGVHPLAGYTVRNQDQSVFWVANDLTVRRRNGQTPQRVSNSGIEQILQAIDSPNGNQGNLSGCYGLAPTVGGHPIYIIMLPNAISPEGTTGRSLCYDCLTQKWFELESMDINGIPLGMWRVLSYHNGAGLQLVGDLQSGQVGALDPLVFSEFNQLQICEFTTQSLYDKHNRLTCRRLELVVSAGLSGSLTVAPIADLLVSYDAGRAFESFSDPQNMGVEGDTLARVIWWNLGQGRDLAFKFRITDPSPVFFVDIQAEIQGGKY
jgi:hypothetical protein